MNAIFEGRCPRVLCALAVGAGLLSSAQIVLAQQAADEPVQRVEITGSSIKRIESEGALPVQTFTRAEIERSGATSAVELIQSLPAMQGFTSTNESVGAGGAGLATASLRSLGSRTLVLLNGKRLASWAGQTLTGYGDGIDLNMIPLAAIERVEVLTDGASALYGTDAIGGVVNFITRTNFEKFELFGSASRPQKPGGQDRRVSLTKGWGSLGTNGFNVMIGYTKDHADPIASKDREYAKTGLIFYEQDGHTFRFRNDSFRAFPANIFTDLDNIVDGPSPLLNPYQVVNPTTCPAGHFLRGNQCRFDYTATLQITPTQDRESIYLSVNQKLPGDHTAYAEYVQAESKVLSRIAPAPVDVLLTPTGNPYLWNQMTTTYGLTPINPVDMVLVGWRMVPAGNRTELDTTQAKHFVFGTKGALFGWDYDASYINSRNTWRQDYVSGWISNNAVMNAITSADAATPTLLNPFDITVTSGYDSIQFKGEYKSAGTQFDVLSLRGSRDVFAAPGGAAMLGAGVDYRSERATYTPSSMAMGVGDVIAGDSALERPFDVGRKAWGVFGELLYPVQKGLDITGALRHDKYSDFGGTTNGKVSARWSPVKEWLVRASVGTGFKAPSVPQTANVTQLYGVTGGTYNCPTVLPAAYVAGCMPPDSQYNVFAQGSPDLKPETSRQFSLGMRFEPGASFSIGVDYWNVRLQDRIGQVDESVIFGDPLKYQSQFMLFTDPATGQQTLAILLKNQNLGEARTAGLDFDIGARFGSPVGPVTSRILWTRMLRHDLQNEKGGAFHSDLGDFQAGLGNAPGPVFRDVLRWVNTLDQGGGFRHTLTANYKSGYKDQAYSAADCLVVDLTLGACADSTHKVDAYYTFDWQTSYDWSKAFKLTAGIINMFDKDPPVSIKNVGGHQLGFDARYTDPRGRTFYLNLRYEM